ncbi:hypothetical protein FRC09_009932 [Ceratobasidium sp. 395]|nr:hypothetical protein FRC09_009932 [Ceratobasidium sp. 395]
MKPPQHSEGSGFCHRALEIAELVHAICGFLDEKGRVNLLRVSRHLHATLLPLVWEDVDFKHVLSLVPGMSVTPDDPEAHFIVFNFPTTSDITRFDVHSPFVKTLRTSHAYAINFPEEWPSFSSGSTAQPLLPNLQWLIINSRGLVDIAAVVDWIPRLLHTGLLGLEMFLLKSTGGVEHKYHPWMDSNTSFNLISQISRTCPHIEILRMFPKEIYWQDVSDCVKTWEMVGNWQHLRSLAFSGTLVHDKLLEVLGQLPRLETLSLCSDGRDWVSEHQHNMLDVPSDSFTSLRHLYLHRLNQSTMSCLCQVSALFQHLVTFVVSFESNFLINGEISNAERAGIAMQCLGQNSPHLQNLTVRTRAGDGRFAAPQSTIDKFRCMPLRYLELDGISFDLDPYLDRAESEREAGDIDISRGQLLRAGWENFLVSVPHLEALHLTQDMFELWVLELFASHLPKLRLLCGRFSLSGMAEPYSRSDWHPGTQPMILRGRLFISQSQLFDSPPPLTAEQISNAARFVARRTDESILISEQTVVQRLAQRDFRDLWKTLQPN